MEKRYTIKRTGLLTYDIIDWEQKRTIKTITYLKCAEEYVKKLEAQ